MKSCENKLSCMLNEDIGKLILRVSIAGLMLFHGFFKLFNGIEIGRASCRERVCQYV